MIILGIVFKVIIISILLVGGCVFILTPLTEEGRKSLHKLSKDKSSLLGLASFILGIIMVLAALLGIMS